MVNEKQKIEQKPKVKPARSGEFREIVQDRLFGAIKEGYFVYVIQSERFNAAESFSENKDIEIELVDEIQIKTSPQQALKTYEMLGRLIKQYEKVFGKIQTVEEVARDNLDIVGKS